METEYSIPADNRVREDVGAVCNLSQGIFEKGEAVGEARGEAIGEAGIILNMYKNGYTMEQIASATDKSLEEIRNIVEKRESILARSE